MNQTWHNSKHSRHSKVGKPSMAQSTPTHDNGFHLVTVAMTGHAEEMGSTTASHSSLKCCCLKCSKWEQEREHGIVSIWSMGLLAWKIGRLVLFFAWVLTVILRSRTYCREHTGNTINIKQYATIWSMQVTWQNECVGLMQLQPDGFEPFWTKGSTPNKNYELK